MVRPSLQHALDAITGGPALVRNGRLDIIAANTLGRALHVDAYTSPPPGQLARHAFLDRTSAEHFYPDWDLAADHIVAILRTEAGRDPYDKDLQDLIGELSTRSEEFRDQVGRSRRPPTRHRREALPPPDRRPSTSSSRAPTSQQTRDGSC